MAEETKSQFKAVEVSLDAEGNQVITEITKPAEEETQEEETQEEETQEEEQEEETQEEEQEEAEEEEAAEEEAAEEEEESAEEEFEETEQEDIVDYDELPEAVQKYLDFHEDTGGSMQDFLQANRDFKSMPQDDAIREYLRATNPYLDEDDIQYEMETRFGITEDDTDNEIRAKKVAKKKFHGEAVKSLTESNAKHKVDLESSTAVPQKAKEALQFQEQFEANQAAQDKSLKAARSSFEKETNKVLGKDFKGFKVKIGEETHLYKPSDVKKTKESNLNVNNLLGRFTDKEGRITDVEGYHKSITAASNPDEYAQHFYDLGVAAATEKDVKDSKNIKMKPRQVQTSKDNSKQQFKFVDLDGAKNKKAKIKLRNY